MLGTADEGRVAATGAEGGRCCMADAGRAAFSGLLYTDFGAGGLLGGLRGTLLFAGVPLSCPRACKSEKKALIFGLD